MTRLRPPGKRARRLRGRRLRRRAFAVALVVGVTGATAAAWAAVSQVEQMTVCSWADGHSTRLNPYEGDCPSGSQEVKWDVEPAGVTTTTKPATTTTATLATTTTLSTTTTQPPTTTTTRPPTTTTQPATTTTTQPAGGGVSPPPGGGTCGTSDQPSTYAGVTLTIAQAIQAAYDGGFHAVSDIRTVVAIGRAESSLTTRTRNWHNSYNGVVQWRPATDVIGVQGPASVWCGGRQFHSDRGWLQISSKWWPQFTDAQSDGPVSAVQVTKLIYVETGTWDTWDTWKFGDAQALQPSAATVCATVPATGCP